MEVLLITSFSHYKRKTGYKKSFKLDLTQKHAVTPLSDQLRDCPLFNNRWDAKVQSVGNNLFCALTASLKESVSSHSIDFFVVKGKEPSGIDVFLQLSCIGKTPVQEIRLSSTLEEFDFIGLAATDARYPALKASIQKLLKSEIVHPEPWMKPAALAVSCSGPDKITITRGVLSPSGLPPPEHDLDFTATVKFQAEREFLSVQYFKIRTLALVWNRDQTIQKDCIESLKVENRENLKLEPDEVISRLRTEMDALLCYKRALLAPANKAQEDLLHSVQLNVVRSIEFLRLKFLDDLIAQMKVFVETHGFTAAEKAKHNKSLKLFERALEFLCKSIEVKVSNPEKPKWLQELVSPVLSAEHHLLEGFYKLLSLTVKNSVTGYRSEYFNYVDSETSRTKSHGKPFVGFFWCLDLTDYNLHSALVTAAASLFVPKYQSYWIGRKTIKPRWRLTNSGPEVLFDNGTKKLTSNFMERELFVFKRQLGTMRPSVRITTKGVYFRRDINKQMIHLSTWEPTQSPVAYAHLDRSKVVTTSGTHSARIIVDIGSMETQHILSDFHYRPTAKSDYMDCYHLNDDSDSFLQKLVPNFQGPDVFTFSGTMVRTPGASLYTMMRANLAVPAEVNTAAENTIKQLKRINFITTSRVLVCLSRSTATAAVYLTGLLDVKLPEVGAPINSGTVTLHTSIMEKTPEEAAGSFDGKPKTKWVQWMLKIVGGRTFSLGIAALENLILYRVIQVVHNDTLRLVRPWTEFPASTMKKLLPMINNSPTLDHDIAHPAGILLTCSTVGGAQKEQALHVFRFRLDV